MYFFCFLQVPPSVYSLNSSLELEFMLKIKYLCFYTKNKVHQSLIGGTLIWSETTLGVGVSPDQSSTNNFHTSLNKLNHMIKHTRVCLIKTKLVNFERLTPCCYLLQFTKWLNTAPSYNTVRCFNVFYFVVVI